MTRLEEENATLLREEVSFVRKVQFYVIMHNGYTYVLDSCIALLS